MTADNGPGLPDEVRLTDQRRTLALSWDNGRRAVIPAAELRRACRCSGCSAARQRGSAPVAADDLTIRDVQPAGIAGVQLVFDDGHQRGIYPWDYLVSLSGAPA